MSLVGAISVTVATVSYLVALCMFFKPDARIKALRVASFCMLLFFLASVAVMIIRWFQVLTYRGKLGENNYYYRKRKRFRIALIVLGALCTLFVLVSAVGIFLFASVFSNVTQNLANKSNNMFELRRNKSSNTTSANSTDTESGGFSVFSNVTENLVDKSNDMFELGRNKSSNTTSTNSTDTESGGFRDKNRQRQLQNQNPIPNDTSSSETDSGGGGRLRGKIRNGVRKKRLGNNGEKPEHNRQECRGGQCENDEEVEDSANQQDTEDTTEVSHTTAPIPEDKQHCKDRIAYPKSKDRKKCRREGLKRKVKGFVKGKYVLAAFLGLSFIGHLINVCAALCCNGDPRGPDEGYEKAQSENESDGGEKTEKE